MSLKVERFLAGCWVWFFDGDSFLLLGCKTPMFSLFCTCKNQLNMNQHQNKPPTQPDPIPILCLKNSVNQLTIAKKFALGFS